MERNLLRLFYEIEQAKPYEHQGGGDDEELGVVIREINKMDVNKAGDTRESISPREVVRDNKKKETYSAQYIPKAQVHFLPCNSLHQFPHVSKFQNFFNVVYLSSTAVKMFDPRLNSLIQEDASILVESKKYIVGIGKEEMEKFVNSVDELGEKCGWESGGTFDPCQDNLALFRKKEQ